MSSPAREPEDTQNLLALAGQGDRHALEALLARHRAELHQLVELRLDPRLRARVDASDVVQEAQLEVARRLDDYLQRRPMPFRLWLRQTAYQNLARLHRQHLDADCRSVAREVSLPQQSSVWLVKRLLGGDPAPVQRLLEQELVQRLQQALANLSGTDREVLLMRTFEGLDNHEVAQVLDLTPAAASRRYGRAILRLRQALVTQDSGEGGT